MIMIIIIIINDLLNIFASFCCLLKTETKCAGCLLLKLTPQIHINYHRDGDDDNEEEEEKEKEEEEEGNLYTRMMIVI